MWFGTAACRDGAPYVCRFVLLRGLRPTACCFLPVQFTNSSRRCCPLLSERFISFCYAASPLCWRPTLQSVILYPGGSTFLRNKGTWLPEYTVSRCMWQQFYAELCAMKTHDVGSPQVHLGWNWWQAATCFVIALADGRSSRQVAHCFLWKNNRHRCIH